MNKEQLRQAFYAVSPHDLASDADDNYRNAIDSVLDEFASVNAERLVA